MSSSSYLLHTDEAHWINANQFNPQRWIDDKTTLTRNFVPFARGSRQCIGMNLAYAELYLTVATIFSRFDFELYQTTRRDVELAHDFFVGMPPLDSQGIRARVSKQLL